MSALLSLLLNPRALLIAGIAGLLLYVGLCHYRIERLHRDVRVERARHFATFVRSGGDLIMARCTIGTLRGAIDAQNLAIQAHSAESARRLQAAQEALREARRATPRVVERVRVIQAPIVSTGALERFREVDRRVLEGLR